MTLHTDQEVKVCYITCTSASKTFNLAGLQLGNIILGNEHLRTAFVNELRAEGYSQPNTLGMVATQAESRP